MRKEAEVRGILPVFALPHVSLFRPYRSYGRYQCFVRFAPAVRQPKLTHPIGWRPCATRAGYPSGSSTSSLSTSSSGRAGSVFGVPNNFHAS